MTARPTGEQLVITLTYDLEEDESAVLLTLAIGKLLSLPLEVDGQFISNWYSSFKAEIKKNPNIT